MPKENMRGEWNPYSSAWLRRWEVSQNRWMFRRSRKGLGNVKTGGRGSGKGGMKDTRDGVDKT